LLKKKVRLNKVVKTNRQKKTKCEEIMNGKVTHHRTYVLKVYVTNTVSKGIPLPMSESKRQRTPKSPAGPFKPERTCKSLIEFYSKAIE
jgi:hypothetical protein